MSPVITVTPAARAKIDGVRAKSGHPDACLRIAIAGRRGGEFVYELDLVASGDAPPGDLVVETPNLRLRLQPVSAANRDVATIELDASLMRGSLRIENPHNGIR